jgi:hypothetical protein
MVELQSKCSLRSGNHIRTLYRSVKVIVLTFSASIHRFTCIALMWVTAAQPYRAVDTGGTIAQISVCNESPEILMQSSVV